MIWQFGELGYDYSIDFNGRVGEKPIRRDYLEDKDRNDLYRLYSLMIKTKTSTEGFNSGDLFYKILGK